MSSAMPPEACPLSVVVPVYNGTPWLDQTLASIAGQCPRPRRMIVVDDCSQDDPAPIAARFGAEYVRLTENVGPGAARAAGAALVDTALVAFCDQDDIWLPGMVARSLATLQRAPWAWMVAHQALLASETFCRPINPVPPGSRMGFLDFAVWPPIWTVTQVVFRTEAYRRSGGFPIERHFFGVDDSILWWRSLAQGLRGTYVHVPGVVYRLHAAQTNKSLRLNKRGIDPKAAAEWDRLRNAAPAPMRLLMAASNRSRLVRVVARVAYRISRAPALLGSESRTVT